MDNSYILIAITLAFSFFFSGIEIAFLSANKLQIELQGKQGVLWGRIMSYFLKRQSWFIGTTLIGNTLALVLFGIYMAQLIEPWLASNLPQSINDEVFILIFQTLISTLLILFTAEFLPKSLFLINPNLMLAALAVPFRIIYFILAPLTFSIVYLSKIVIIHVLRIEYSEEKPVFALTDLNNYLKSMLKVRHDDEDVGLDKKIFHNALEFKTVRIRDCMIPRTEVTAIDVEEGIDKLRDSFIQSGHSKVLIYKETIDNVIGYCHSSALFKKPQRIEEILTPINIVQETMMANNLMVQLIKEQKSMALVVDEFGGTSGIVSMEDVIEEIFGEIEDEHDDDDLVEEKIDDTTYLLSARLEIDYLNDHYKWQLPKGDYETLAGLILSYTEDFPAEGETVAIPPYSFTIQKTENKLINTVKLTVDLESLEG
ncbi:MAG: HlyC/CorC family transporter [Cytophagales bacterium]|jgi:putative hemolysin|nr:HlyC/CorC family transporter [Cytophagales bacterium]MCA6386998.1 HlyC/CorC family transporter [Cytophagales bacterium]MCA6390088.1 HlyC/CorC family transporter [Cytophagales bacterium]MCA6394820.1 HlyC/CorC family transporter [Cytophagales bacterium]MCA6399413.1 HlyC/CorC family transporter [Cytophagales bacterium]